MEGQHQGTDRPVDVAISLDSFLLYYDAEISLCSASNETLLILLDLSDGDIQNNHRKKC